MTVLTSNFGMGMGAGKKPLLTSNFDNFQFSELLMISVVPKTLQIDPKIC